jgi:transposase
LKQPVFGIFERDGEVYTEIVPDCSSKTLQRLIRGHVSMESVLHSDGWRGYNGLVDVGFDRHFRINKSEAFAKHGVHINGIESFWSFVKRRLAKFNGLKKNFDIHLKECEWRWSKSSSRMRDELLIIIRAHDIVKTSPSLLV